MSYDEILGKAFLGEQHYNSLLHFFQQIWDNPSRFRYRALITRRSFNLNQLFMGIANAEDGSYDLQGVCSAHALMGESAALAQEYLATGAFPPILLVQDIMIHGRTAQKFMLDLEDSISAILRKEDHDKAASLIRDLHWNLAKVVHVQVYLSNDEPSVMQDEYSTRLSCERRVNRKNWLDLSQRISWLIQSSSVANTSSVLSARAAKSPNPSAPVWEKVHWELRERSEEFFFFRHKRAAADDRSIIFAIRTYCTSDGADQVTYIPFVLAQADSDLQMAAAADELAALIRQNFSAETGAVLSEYVEERAPQRDQFFSLIFSAVVLNHFAKDMEIQSLQYDTRKIWRNFGVDSCLQAALEELVSNDRFLAQCERAMLNWLVGYPDAELKPAPAKPDPQLRYRLNRIAEDRMFALRMETEWEAACLVQKGRAYYPGAGCCDACSLDEFLMSPELRAFPLYHRLCCLLMLSDAGVVSLEPGAGGMLLRADDQALFCKPRQLALYMPALIKIEHRYLGQGEEVVYEKIEGFQEYVKAHSVYDPSGLRAFAEAWYQAGGRLHDWDLNLLYSLETEEEDYNCDRVRRIMGMVKRQEEMRALCTEYLGD